MKTICFDLRALQIGHEKRGIGMYLRSVLENMPSDDNKYLFYCFDKSNPIEALNIKLNINYEIVKTPSLNTILSSPLRVLDIIKLINHRFRPLKKYRPDVFVQFDFTLGIPKWKNTKTVVIGHDLIPLIQKNEYLPSALYAWAHSDKKLRASLRAIYYRAKYGFHYRVYKKADVVVCISAFTAGIFESVLGINSEKLIAIPLAPVLSTDQPDNSLSSKLVRPYILYVGGADGRKNVQDIVRAFNIVRGRGLDVQLVLAGYDFQDLNKMTDVVPREAITNSPYRSDIVLFGFVTGAEKLGLYKSAWAFVSASSYEGFGLSIVEAMSASCPVISYNNSSIPETAGDAALLVDTGDYVGIANALIRLEDELTRQEIVKLGLEQAKKYTWSQHVYSLRKVLEN